MITIIQPSLNPNSKTAVLCHEAISQFKSRQITPRLIDFRKLELEFCDGRAFHEYNDSIKEAYQSIQESEIVLIGCPVYCWSISGVLKNFIDITAKAFEGKKIGILVQAGSPFAYLASAELMKILSFEANATTVQPIVKSNINDFDHSGLKSKKVEEKIMQLLDALLA
ncbi:NAD(P)H-dependent oxidoreductase [Candidatus Peregrinibacteria bacterium]|nr:MAG: NAD(P)H-dependent oxidoreductase [Candidatus Peregrinibacteria bacterium]